MAMTPEEMKEFQIKLWAYREKDAWFNFRDAADPELITAIERLVDFFHGGETTDRILKSGIQYQAKCLRIASQLGLVDFDWDQ